MSELRRIQERDAHRRRMVEDQLAARGIVDRRVLDAAARVEREAFVAPDYRHMAYGDHPLPIECGQTISQPFTVAFMIQAAQISENDRVLEIGTGSGYGAAVLSLLTREVHTVERIPLLAESACARLSQLGYSNVHVHQADGTLGLPEQAPFDVIIVTAGARKLPPTYVEQLSDGGRIVIPVGKSPRSQMMYRYTLISGKLSEESLGRFAFVPLVGVHGWSE